MNILAGIYFPDNGQILLGRQGSFQSAPPRMPSNSASAWCTQHFKLVDNLTAAENIVLGLREKGRLDRGASPPSPEAGRKVRFFHQPGQKKSNDMSVSEKQTVEIIKVLYRGANYPHPRRADGGPHRPGCGQAVPHSEKHAGRRQIHRYHHPQAAGGFGNLRPGNRLAQGRKTRAPSIPPTPPPSR
jgi:hypothetical protein